MTNAALRGKPDAGNLHVRFDEGEVALAATPRRGSLLYKKSKQGAPDSARLFDASRARAGASTGVPAPTRVPGRPFLLHGGSGLPTRGGGTPYTGWPFSLHGGERFPYTEQTVSLHGTKGFPARVRREWYKQRKAKGPASALR